MGRPFTELLQEGQAVAGANIGTANNSAINTGALRMGFVGRARAFLHTGTLTGAASLNFRLQASATEAGSYADITAATTSPAINTITTDDGWFSIEIRGDQMPAGKPWLRAQVTETATANAVLDVFIVGDCCEYSPGNQFDDVTWTSQVVTMP